ncbi:unnamed protein product [Auanema sp. JU1783]|nr:unnamed protein product [Auanema sp. JU1783]
MAGVETGQEPMDSIYSQEVPEDKPWWQRTLMNDEKVRLGTWDGVFATVMVNIFGIIIFLRMGWIVGTAGVDQAIFQLAICTTLSMITVFSAIGIIERCQIKGGGVYSLIAHVLGSRIGGAVAIIYTLGQAVATALVAVGLGESLAHFFGTESKVFVKFIAIVTLAALTGINAAGVLWVVRLQLLMLFCLAMAVLDFGLGFLFTSDEEHGVYRVSSARLQLNSQPHYDAVNCTNIGIDRQIPSQTFFTVFGVFFANFLGILAGVNMSGDLKEPKKSIPLGELSAVAVSSFICFIMILILGSVADRYYLLCDYLIEEKVSLTKMFFLLGLYLCSLSSTIGSLLGTPRVLQGIASEGIIPALNPLAQASGTNSNPIVASIVLMTVASLFVLLADLNKLAILSTMPFLLTYAYVNYAYVSLAMSYDIVHYEQQMSAKATDGSNYGSTSAEANSDLNQLFPERTETTLTNDDQNIITQPTSWYSMFSNRYVSFMGFVANIVLIIMIDKTMAFIHFSLLFILYLYIGVVSPHSSPGISMFTIPKMIRTIFVNAEPTPQTDILNRNAPDLDLSTTAVNQVNDDYYDRKPYHAIEQLPNRLN